QPETHNKSSQTAPGTWLRLAEMRFPSRSMVSLRLEMKLAVIGVGRSVAAATASAHKRSWRSTVRLRSVANRSENCACRCAAAHTVEETAQCWKHAAAAAAPPDAQSYRWSLLPQPEVRGALRCGRRRW